MKCGVSDNYRMCFMWLSSVRSNKISHHIALHGTDTSAPIPISFGSNLYWRLTIYSVYLASLCMVCLLKISKLSTHRTRNDHAKHIFIEHSAQTLLLYSHCMQSLCMCIVYRMHFIRRYSLYSTLFPFFSF